MTLAAGSRLGRYEIRSKIGEGGMGEVYRARDGKLNRDVAIKVLPTTYSRDAQRLRRFEQEAQAAGALNHPNILAVYDVGTHDDAPYVVSELLEGESLKDRLHDGPIAQRKAINYAIQVAHGLAAAHEKGIIHRDIKPDNLFVTKDDRVKILDFGIAKLIEPIGDGIAQTDVATRKVHTDPGSVVGTVGYMSPEQVRGRAVDYRSDIFSFGAVLYEMLSGQRAFRGESAVETLNSILKDEPKEIATSDGKISPAMERVVWHCLEKSAERRFQSATDVAFALESLSGSSISAQTETTALTLAPPKRAKWREHLPWGIAGVALLLVVAAFALPYLRRTSSDVNVVRFPITLPEKAWFHTDVEQHNVSISPDGRRLALIAVADGQKKLYLRAFDQLETKALPGTEGAYSPFWSPDSRFVAFFAGGKLKKIEAAGGPVQTICDVPPEDTTGSWGRDGTILYLYYQKDFRGLYRVSAAGGAPSPALKAEKVDPYWVAFLPDGQHFLFYGESKQDELRGIYTGALGSQEVEFILQTPRTRPEYAPPGYLLHAREGALIAQSFDATSLRVSGEPAVVVEHLPYFDKTGWSEFSVSETGTLAYSTDFGTARLAWFDRTGREVGQVGEPDLYSGLRLSPDGQKLAAAVSDPRTSSGDIWIYDLARNARSRFAFGPMDESDPIWSPDGRQLAYFACCESSKSSLRLKDTGDATGEAESPLGSGFLGPSGWSADGRFIIYTEGQPERQTDLWVLSLAGDRKPFPFVQTEFDERGAHFSPDGHFVAYVSDESGADEVYVKRFEGAGEKWRVSTAGGSGVRWRRDGRELFYLAADGKLMSVTVKSGDGFEAAAPVPLFSMNLVGDYDVAADGQRFILATGVTNVQSMPFTIVLNWMAGIKK